MLICLTQLVSCIMAVVALISQIKRPAYLSARTVRDTAKTNVPENEETLELK